MDNTACKGEGCPVKERCKRFSAEPGMMQSYFVDTPGRYELYENSPTVKQRQYDKVWRCDMFWGEQQDTIMEVLKKAVGGNE
jgi:hypothetical protein